MKTTFLCLLLSSLCSCAFIKREGRWGKDAFKFRAKSIGRAFVDNATDPHVWVPLAGAAALAFSKQDQKISDWASKEGPLYGSKKVANEESNEQKNIMRGFSYATLFLTTSWDDNYADYAFSKAKGGAVMYMSNMASHTSVNKLQETFKRERPNMASHTSMPSSHSARTSTYHLLVRRNLAHSHINPYANKALLFASSGLTATVMWARVEAKAHYPSDTLVGYSLGQFVGGVIFDSLMNLESDESLAVYPSTTGGMTAMYSVLF